MENSEHLVHPGEMCLLPPFFTHASFFPSASGPDVRWIESSVPVSRKQAKQLLRIKEKIEF